MTPESYVSAVETIARTKSLECFHSFRRYLANIYGEKEDRCDCWNQDRLKHDTCEKCIVCERCSDGLFGITIRYNPKTQPHSIHSSNGDYENYPEVYLAEYLTKPWYDHKKIKYSPYGNDLFAEGVMFMTEDEIVDGLTAIFAKYPAIGAWISFDCLNIAITARMIRVIAFLTEKMERRNAWFAPGGALSHLSTVQKSLYRECYSVRLDMPPQACVGPHNIPDYLQGRDGSASTMNACHDIERWLQEKDTNANPEWIPLLGRALASNTREMGSIECASMNGYKTITPFVGCISHEIKPDGKIVTNMGSNYSTPMTPQYTNIIWHTIRSRCKYCDVYDSKKYPYPPRYCSISDVIQEPVPKTPYEQVMDACVRLRRRRLRGVFFCAMRLLGKARAIHYMPGIGSYFKEAQADFYSALTTTSASDTPSTSRFL